MIRAYRPFTKTVRALSLLMAVLAMLFASTAVLAQTMASSVSQHGITWYFDQEHEVGRYANGDWWVLGPVTITNITPESGVYDERIKHGSQVNPVQGSRQGFDDHPADMSYDPELNVAPSMTGESLTLTQASLVSSISLENPRSSGRPTVRDLAVLTVTTEVPPAGSFRPSPYSTTKEHKWNESDLDYSILRSLPRVANTPDLKTSSARALRFWTEQPAGSWRQRTVQASNNMPNYGRDIQNGSGRLLLMLHLDYPEGEKRDLYVGLVQMGLDIYGRFLAGGTWMSNGGHNAGRKMPMLLAGLALGDANIIARANRDEDPDRFQDDGQTFYVTQEDVEREHRERGGGYTTAHIGMPEWGIRHATDPIRDDVDWSARYRWIGGGMVAHALAAHLTEGAVDAWNWPAYFDYVDRYFSIETGPDGNHGVGGTNGIDPFFYAMWNAYRHSEFTGPAVSAPVAPRIFVE